MLTLGSRFSAQDPMRLGAGNKASHLDELACAGFPVPAGFVIPAGSPDKGEDLESAVEAIGGYPLAVRSSAVAEDRQGASYAGIYLSLLNIASAEELIPAIEQVQGSASGDSSENYQRRLGAEEAVSSQSNSIAVLVQRMVDAAYAGVAFTLDPLSGRDDVFVVETCRGLADRLVGGQIQPARVTLSAADGIILDCELGGEPDIPAHGFFEELHRVLLEIQAYFGCPQDVEWVLDQQDRLWVVQSRSVTAFGRRPDLEEFTTADMRDGGVSARVCTPLMFSLYRDAMSESMPQYLRAIRLLTPDQQDTTWIDSFYGRPYWNAGIIKKLMNNVIGFNEQEFDEGLGIRKNYGKAGPRQVGVSPRSILRSLPIAMAISQEEKRQELRIRDFLQAFQVEHEALKRSIRSLALAGPAEYFTFVPAAIAHQQKTEKIYFRSIYVSSNCQTNLCATLNLIEKRTGYRPRLNLLLSGLQDIDHLDIHHATQKLLEIARTRGLDSPEWLSARDQFIEELGYHSDVELDLLTPRWAEVPDLIEERIRLMLLNPASTQNNSNESERIAQAFETEKSDILRHISKLPAFQAYFLKKKFLKHLTVARRYMILREKVRDRSTRAYALVRHAVLDLGQELFHAGLMDDPEDVFFLHTDELCQLARTADRGSSMRSELTAKLKVRRLLYKGYRNFDAPGEIGQGILTATESPVSPDHAPHLKGLACSAGIIEGRARILTDLTNSQSFQPGDILVTRFTDPAWTAILGIAAGVITECGGMLSHAAVIAREYGIPAVLNVSLATNAILDGARIRVNGDLGTIEVLA